MGRMSKNTRIKGIIRPLDDLHDPRHPDNSRHEEKYLEIARVFGTAMADRDFEIARKKRYRQLRDGQQFSLLDYLE